MISTFAKFATTSRSVQSLTGIGKTLARRIIKDLGGGDEQAAMKVITHNPYRLIDVDGIAFTKADRIATKDFDLNLDDSRRHEAGNQYIVGQYGPITWAAFRKYRRELSLYNPENERDGIVEDRNLVWLPGELACERFLAQWIRGLYDESRDWKSNFEFGVPDASLINLDGVQAGAVMFALENPWKVMMLTGDAGTGKTHVISNIAKLAHKRGLTTQVLAFAGKAADRAREALEKAGAPAGASTIHRALGLGRDGAFGTPDELGADIVIVDEASMIPNWLFAMVIMSLKPKARLVIVGDEAQLPPIGYGTPFCDMLALKLPMIRLAKNYRQRDQLGILEVAKSIRDRTSYPDFEQDAAVRIHAVGDEWIQVANDIIENVKTRALNWDEWQVVTFKNDMRERLNQGIQETVNPTSMCLFTVKAWTLDEKELEIRVNDKVIVTKNDYECDVFNGQIGVVIRLEERLPFDLEARTKGEKQLGVLLEMRGQERWIPLDMATELLTLGYAITCHKAQGSGWQNVIVIQPDRVNGESNKWWYTACTRAENQLTIISSMNLDTLWQNTIQRSSVKDSSLFERVREASRVNN